MRSVALAAVAAAIAVACAGDPQPSTAPTAPSTAVATDPVDSTTESTLASGRDACADGRSQVDGQVQNPLLTEASGLVASRRHDDVFWAHNDGNEVPGLFAIGADGRDLGLHPLDIGGIVDVEDLALVVGATGDDLLLADIGDNQRRRSSVRLYRVPEPDPTQPGPLRDVQLLEFAYPDGAHNAEVLLVDEIANTAVIVTKEQEPNDQLPRDLAPTAPSFVFEGPLDGHGAGPIVLDLVGSINMPELATRTFATTPHASTLLGIGGLPTAGDVSSDGALVALRTYETAWMWEIEQGQPVAEALAGDPCQLLVAAETQGEALAFDGDDLVSVGEGAGRPINRLVR